MRDARHVAEAGARQDPRADEFNGSQQPSKKEIIERNSRQSDGECDAESDESDETEPG